MTVKLPAFQELILFEDDRYIVINKPPGISSLEDRSYPLNILRMAREFNKGLQLCHRLDKETSGVLLLAKDPEAYRQMARRFESRKVQKIYHAVVDGLHDFKETIVDVPIGTLRKGEAKINFVKGKKSLTIFNSLIAYKNHTLVKCEPVTGRLHQIRVHLAWLQAPVTGDILYGGKPFYLSSVKRNYRLGKYEEERPLIQRFALHAVRLSFISFYNCKIDVEAPYPKDFRVLITQLTKNS